VFRALLFRADAGASIYGMDVLCGLAADWTSDLRELQPEAFPAARVNSIVNRPKLQYFVLGVLLFCALNAQLAYTGINLYVLSHASQIASLPFSRFDQTLKISAIPPKYGNSGLKVNDEIIALNGKPVSGSKLLDEMSFSLHPGDLLVVKVSRNAGGQGVY